MTDRTAICKALRRRPIEGGTFAETLYDIASDPNCPEIIWQPQNDAGIIVGSDRIFTNKGDFDSFRRKMYEWGFRKSKCKRGRSSPECGRLDYWFHSENLFVKGHKERLCKMACQSGKRPQDGSANKNIPQAQDEENLSEGLAERNADRANFLHNERATTTLEDGSVNATILQAQDKAQNLSQAPPERNAKQLLWIPTTGEQKTVEDGSTNMNIPEAPDDSDL